MIVYWLPPRQKRRRKAPRTSSMSPGRHLLAGPKWRRSKDVQLKVSTSFLGVRHCASGRSTMSRHVRI
jgi:hypothetical protein